MNRRVKKQRTIIIMQRTIEKHYVGIWVFLCMWNNSVQEKHSSNILVQITNL